MSPRTDRWKVAVIGLGATLAPAIAGASTFLALDMEGLVAASDTVVVGEVVATASYWDAEGRVILTDATVEVGDRWVGDAPRFVTVTTFGGKVGDFEVVAHGFPTFREGERLALFLDRQDDGTARVAGYQLGVWRVIEQGGETFVEPTVDAGATLVGGASIPLTVQELSTFRADVRRAATHR